MKIAHLTVIREMLSGKIKQLEFEATAASKLEAINWSSVTHRSEQPTSPLVRRIPWLLRSFFMRNLLAWLIALTLGRKNNNVLLRRSPAVRSRSCPLR